MIEIRNLEKTFNIGTPNENKVFENLSLKLEDGDFVTVIGGNGAGKSTLLNIIAGNIEADKGLILINNNDISSLSEYKRAPYFGRVFQDPMKGTATDMTILENLALAYGRRRHRSLFRWSINKKDKEFYIEQLKSLDLGLENFLTQKVGVLSGGQRQALTLLMATIRKEPSYSSIRKDYIRFFDGDKSIAKKEFDDNYKASKAILKNKLNELKNQNLSKHDHDMKVKEAKKEFDSSIRKFDSTKPILLLDEHTAALDPKTASKVLQITNRIVNEHHLTTIMVTHNMKNAIEYGNRLVMMSKGNIVVDVKGEEKEKITIDKLMELFNSKSNNDFLSDSTILGD